MNLRWPALCGLDGEESQHGSWYLKYKCYEELFEIQFQYFIIYVVVVELLPLPLSLRNGRRALKLDVVEHEIFAPGKKMRLKPQAIEL